MIKEYYYHTMNTMNSNFELKFKISITFITLTNSKASHKLIPSLALVHIYM